MEETILFRPKEYKLSSASDYEEQKEILHNGFVNISTNIVLLS